MAPKGSLHVHSHLYGSVNNLRVVRDVRSGSTRRRRGLDSPRQQLVREFEQKAPKVGEPLGDIELLDSDGNRFRWESIRGQHAVLVFGCLT